MTVRTPMFTCQESSHVLPLSRRRALGAILLSLTCRSTRGDDVPRTLKFTVKDEFGSAPPANIEALLRSAADAIWRHCPQTTFLGTGFAVYRNAKYPITHFQPDKEGRIVIGLSTGDLYWAQYGFQFGHEFCHALLDHTDARQWHKVEQANQWLDESLCETASLFVLRAMSESWQTRPPYRNWKDFAPRLASYAQDRIDQTAALLPTGTSFAAWFAAELPGLRERWSQRDKNTLIASQLLPLFEADPAGWESLPAMRLGTRDARKPLDQHFAEWKTNAPERSRPFIAKIAKVFAVT
jgi:hypothetical protein